MMIGTEKEIRYVREHIAPFDLNTVQGTKTVYAHLVETEEGADNAAILALDIYTYERIETYYQKHVIGNSEDYIPISYRYVVTNPDYRRYCEDIRRRCLETDDDSKKGWIKGSLSLNAPDCPKGYLALSMGFIVDLDIDPNLPVNLDKVSFVPLEYCVYDSYVEKIRAVWEKIFEDVTRRVQVHIRYTPPVQLPEPNVIEFNNHEYLYNVRMYKVGHGNTITIEDKDCNHCLLFDCGGTGAGYEATMDYIRRNVKPTVIMFSHWHRDHCNLINDIDCDRLTNIFIPDSIDHCTSNDVAEKIRELMDRGVEVTDLSAIGDLPADFLRFYGFSNISVFRGTGRRDPGPRSRLGHISYDRTKDDTGLILSIKSYDRDYYAVLPGDCSYYSWPNEPELDPHSIAKMVLPHHGGHIIRKYVPDIPEAGYRSILISSSNTTFEDRRDNNGETYHKTFVRNVFGGNNRNTFISENLDTVYKTFMV